MAISSLGIALVVPFVKLPAESQHRNTLRFHDSSFASCNRQSISSFLRQPGVPPPMLLSKSLVWKSIQHVGGSCERQSSFLVCVSALGAQTVKKKTHTTVLSPVDKKTWSLDDGGNGNGNAPYDMDGSGGSKGRGGWGGWGGGGGGANWGPSSGGLILFGILLFLSYLKDLENKGKVDEKQDCLAE